MRALEGLAADPHAHLVVRASHVTYRPVDSGVEEQGLAVELKSRSLGGELALLPVSLEDGPVLVLAGADVATLHQGSTWTQAVQTSGRLFMASGADTAETTAILRAMLSDEGIEP